MSERKDVEFNRRYWDAFYKENRGHLPSQFCVSVLTELDPDTVVVELGSGNGRDAHYFASRGHITIAMDISREAIKLCREYVPETNSHHPKFFQGDLTSHADLRETVGCARRNAGDKKIVCYSRFVIHTLDDEQESAFLTGMAGLLEPEESIYFEFRSKQDSGLKKLFDGHYRRYVDTDAFTDRLASDLGLSIDYCITGQGMAKYRDEDPYVSRVIARKI